MPRRPPGQPPKRKTKTKIPINWADVADLLKAHGTAAQIAGHIGCCADTLVDRMKQELGVEFTELATQYRGGGQMEILMGQFKSARKGNVQMLLHLGKQWCGQGEKESSLSHELQISQSMAASDFAGTDRESTMETEQSLLCEEGREENPVQDELGSTGALEE